MLDWIRRITGDPPTNKQLKYAQQLGLKIKSGVTRAQLSDAIDRHLDANPQIRRCANQARKRISQSIDAQVEQRIPNHKDRSGNFLHLVAYMKKGEVQAEVVECIDGYKNGRNQCMIECQPWVWTKSFGGTMIVSAKVLKIRLEDVLHAERVRLSVGMSRANHAGAVRRGLRLGKRELKCRDSAK